MPKAKKQQQNGFYYYMCEIKPQLQREGRVFPNGMADVVPVAHPRWKALTAADRDRYEGMAKKAKKEQQRNPNSRKLDNMGNIISERQDPRDERIKRKQKEFRIVRSRWPNNEAILEEKMYFIAFEVLCELPADTKHDLVYQPRELAIVEWSMAEGITNVYQEFIDPGAVPLGFRYQCMSHSEETHQIPVGEFEKDTKDYMGLWIRMKNFINPGGKKKEYPPLYCLGNEMRKVEDCMDWIYNHSTLRGHEGDVLHKIYYLENVVPLLYDIANSIRRSEEDEEVAVISEAGAIDVLTTSAFDYEKGTRCEWHEEKEVKYCAVAVCKRYAYSLSDSLAAVFDFELTPKHLPTRNTDAPAFTVVAAPALDYNFKPNRRGGGGSWNQQQSGDCDNDGPFGARDYRTMQQRQPQEPTFSQGLRRPNAPPLASQAGATGYTAPRAPWATSSVPAQPSDASFSDDFPSLGGGSTTEKAKCAGRAIAPAPSAVPVPGCWQNAPVSRMPNSHPQAAMMGGTIPPQQQKSSLSQAVAQQQPSLAEAVQQQQSKPTLGQAVSQQKPTLGQAVQQQEKPTLGQAVQQQQKPTLGQAVQQQERPTLGQAVQQQQKPTLGQAVQQQQRPTLGQAVAQQQKPSLGQAVAQQQKPSLGEAVVQQQQFAPAPASNPWAQGPPPMAWGRGAVRSNEAPGTNPTLSFGRGRGILSEGAARAPGQPSPSFLSQPGTQHPGQPAEYTSQLPPPPGLGRGLTIQMDEMSLSGPH